MNGATYQNRLQGEADGFIRSAADRLEDARRSSAPAEETIGVGIEPYVLDDERFTRLIDICEEASMAAETAIKGYIAGVEKKQPKYVHSFKVLLSQVSPDCRERG